MEKSGPKKSIVPTEAGTATKAPKSSLHDVAADTRSASSIVHLQEQNREANLEVSDLQLQLAKARRKPLDVFRDLILYKILSFLSRKNSPSTKLKTRFRKSAAKRDPLRSLPEMMRAEIEAEFNADNANNPRLARMVKSSAALKSDSAKRTVMVVSHEASRTGAPILALNISQQLASKYNVVVVIMGGGPLRDEFRTTAVAMYELDQHPKHKISASIQSICSQHEFAYALVNSVESRSALPGLKVAGVPIVALLHEFASYTRPRSAFSNVLRDADQVVFSTRITLENALEQYGIERSTSIQVLPQGKCIVPAGNLCDSERESERRWLDEVLRPDIDEDREFVVLGAGSIESRKAVDLFLECATRVIESPGGGRFRFIWIGGGYDPEKDIATSAYLADQIKRAGIQSQASIVRPTSEIEYAYRVADILMLSSRLDPLPNVAIDALVAGTPVLCFERTTGIADFLLESELGQICVSPYIDTGDMAKKVLALANDASLLADVSSRGREAALRRFDLSRYIDTLDSIATNIMPTTEQIAKDTEVLLSSGEFRYDFFSLPEEDPSDRTETTRQYLEANRSGLRMRKPLPGFNPGVFAVHHEQDAGADPFVRFLRDGKPPGPWLLPVIDEQNEVSTKAFAALRVALHVHVTAPEKLVEIGARLNHNTARPDLFISTTAEREERVRAALKDLSWPVKAVEIVPRRGRDIGALLTTFGSFLSRHYEVIGQIHTIATDEREADPANFLLENLIGGERGGPMLDRVLTAMARDSSLGMVHPDDPNVLNWGNSRAAADNLARRLGFGRLPDQINFPTSNMFWVRSLVLRRFMKLNLNWADYPSGQPTAEDTVLDALPRLFGVVPLLEGMQTAVTNVRGVTR